MTCKKKVYKEIGSQYGKTTICKFYLLFILKKLQPQNNLHKHIRYPIKSDHTAIEAENIFFIPTPIVETVDNINCSSII